ncbi:prolyl oligopeptidase family serine peptidase [uncultured Paludibaculum sp.]|uniref:S9 family peptidase n=1 Tax=uncultured Paludibaculum sp. TaxID=1765020 RepID=UPI002AAAACAF|nr:prolyl oligopeptidase family serine peptidase [uncultured Paludibaculum sp.]
MRSLLIGLILASLLPAAEKWTVDDILLQERVSGLEISRDGKAAVYVKSRMDKEKGEAISHLYLKRLGESDEVQLTRGNDSESGAKFSPDGKRIAFLTSRKAAGPSPAQAPAEAAGGGMQVWFINLAGGEPWSVTKFEKGVRAFEWLDNDTLLIAAPEDSSLYDQKVKEQKDTSQVVDDEKHAPPVRLFKFEVKGSKSTRITRNADRITSVYASPDGAWAVTVHNRSLAEIYDQKVKPVTFLHDLKSGKSTQLFADGKLLPRRFNWTKDSKGFYFSAPYTTHPYLYNASVSLLYYYDPSASKLTKVDLDWENGLSGGVGLTGDGFVALLANGARNKVARYTRNGDSWNRSWIDVDNVQALEVSEDGQEVIYTTSTPGEPAKLLLAKLDGAKFVDPKTFLETNSNWKKKPIAKTELVTWKGAQDEQVEGILYYPHNYTAGKKYPLVVMIHGGPHGHDAYAFNESMGYPHQLYAQRGAFLFKPNYHGSSNYGLKWGESISGGKYNDLEWVDVERGVDSLIARGFIDPEKLGVMGWSNGSIITIELTTRTTRYKVAGAGAGDVNWSSDWGNAVFGDAFEQYYLGKTPMDDPELYIRKSPLYRMNKVKTPTIIFFGTEDKQVPTEQGWQHYRALQHYGQTDVKFILFPGEQHGPRKYVHQRRKVDEELAWFDKYLFGTATDTNEALKPESALAALLKTRNLPRNPETVERGAIAIGRFEVTRSQYHAFDAGYAVAPGTDAYPAGGLTAEQAKAYCAWLSKQTGQTYRLGTEEELGSLLVRSKNENTLDQWAGYAVNADDEARLGSLIDGMAPGQLLKPVGSHAGTGEDPLFDLGGNVAEWVTKKDGTTAALGGSADRPADAKSVTQARPAYVGFRVVRDLK